MDPADKLMKDARTGVLALAVLHVLVNHGALHGYWLRKILGNLMGWTPPETSLYDALKRLEKLGLIKGRWVRSGRGPLRKYYEITDAGRETYEVVVKDFSKMVGWLICRKGRE
ncbi:putative transcriptional regulator, PadR family [Aeropyrum pernix K1]|uniref:Transcriptional regulator, PadR family n=1 Tax=Aeropyrum pernix (strain ATCC 700893 / DSM 11879 / JCM 9820 / NBRC 100138 / K1) TaxID=272557 RepID=Q9YG99_AERPE|nr:PadR family transcriptional regulator [Aeropyrum pernix]BAA78911.1 putative transcriptional regulator, PadR family [Aeropyrum pernix K1]